MTIIRLTSLHPVSVSALVLVDQIHSSCSSVNKSMEMPHCVWRLNKLLTSELNPNLFSQDFFHPHLSFHASFHPSRSLSALSVSSIMMLIKWTEWTIHIPMAGFLPSAQPPAPLYLLQGIIHLALSLYTMLSGRAHTGHASTLTLIRGMFTWLQSKFKRWQTEARFGNSGDGGGQARR